jgi:hypothetical protein
MALTMHDIARKTMEFLRGRSRDYRHSLLSPSGQRVLHDLSKFCRANETCFHEDPRLHAVLEGRREVWLRIQQHLNLTPDQLYTLYNGGVIYNPDGGLQDEAA